MNYNPQYHKHEPCSTTSHVTTLFNITSSVRTEPRQSTRSVTTLTSLSSWCTGHRRCDSSPRFKGRNSMVMSWTSVELLGPRKYSQRVGLHAQLGCDAVSYRFGKGKKSALKLLEIEIPGLNQLLEQPGTTHAQLKATTDSFFVSLHRQKSCTTMNDARARFFRGRKKRKLPPTDVNLQLHVLWAV